MIYLVTDRKVVPGGDLVSAVECALAAVPAGTVRVQLREKDLGGSALFELAKALVGVCHARGAELLVNDRLDVALSAGADGLHLGRRGLTPGEVRAVWPQASIGVSCHSPLEVAEATRDGANFVVFGPVFETPSKVALGLPPVGLGALEAACKRTTLPVFAIGGIEPALAARTREAGAKGVAAIRAIFADLDPGAAAAALLRGFTAKPPTRSGRARRQEP